MNEREFQQKFREIFESLRGHTDMFILNAYYSIDDKNNIIFDEDSLREEFEEKLKEVLKILKEED